MSNPTVVLTRDQLFHALTQLSTQEVQSLIDELIHSKTFSLPDSREVARDLNRIVKEKNLDISIIEEAKQWARSQELF
jgi:hypothetical protein